MVEQSPALADGSIRRIAILRALQLGDLLCAVPAFRALRAALPMAEIILVGLPWARGFVERFGHLLDGFREFPGFPGLPERSPEIGRIPSFLAAMKAERFDMAIQLHGSGPIVNSIVALFGARRSAGFFLTGDDCPDPETYLPWPDRGLEIRRLLGLVESLGAPARGEELEFPLGDADIRSLLAIEEARGLVEGRYACVHPGASVPERRWPASRFAEACRAIHARGLGVVLTGSATEAELTRSVAGRADVPCLDLAGKTDLGSLGVLLSRSRLLICNDTGVSHVAAGLRTPSVVISTGDNPARWAPIDSRRHRVLCRATGVSVEEVVAEADGLIGRGHGGGSGRLAAGDGDSWDRERPSCVRSGS